MSIVTAARAPTKGPAVLKQEFAKQSLKSRRQEREAEGALFFAKLSASDFDAPFFSGLI